MNTSINFPNLHIYLSNVGKTFSIGGFTIAFYGVIIAIGMLVGVSFILKEAGRVGFDEDKFLDVCIITIIVGVVGARIYYVIFSWDSYKDNLISIFNIRQGGLAIYGGILAGLLCLAIMCHVRRYEFLKVMDVVMYGVIIGQIFGRWGNFFNREAFGGYTDNIFAMQLPMDAVRSQLDITPEMIEHLVQIDGVNYISVHPTFLYESLWNIGVLIIMLYFRKRKAFQGEIFFIYLIGYGAGRFWIEALRTDQLLLWGTDIPVSRLLAAILVVLGTGLMAYNLIKNKLTSK